MDLIWRVARSLGDGRFHSGQTLAERFAVSRGSIWNTIRALRGRGLVVHAVRGKGYRLPAPLDWLEQEAVLAALPGDARDSIDRLTVLPETESTNAWLLAGEPPRPGQATVCMADYQTRGRGRRGRHWLSPPGAGVCLSVAWQYLRPPSKLQALGIVAGLAVRRALDSAGVHDVGLKWPNDLMWHDRKLGGILVDLRAEGAGPVHVVAGIGLNHRLPASAAESIVHEGGMPPADLAMVCAREIPGRNRLAGIVTGALIRLLADYRHRAGELLEQDWAAADAIADRPVQVTFGERVMSGIARGLDEHGALLLDNGAELLPVTAGDVRLRIDA